MDEIVNSIKSLNVSSSTDSYCSSIKFEHKFTITNFSRLYDEGYPWKWQISPYRVSPPNNDLLDFELQFYPKGKDETWKDYIAIGVYVTDIPQMYEGKIKCAWNVSIEDENGDRCMTTGFEIHDLYNYQQGKLMNGYVQYSELLNSASHYLPNGQLTLHFEFDLQADELIFNVIKNNEMGWSRFDCSLKVTRVVHTLTIENFADLFDSSTVAPYFIQSDHFPAEQSERFYLRLYPNGWKDVTVHGKISMLDVDGEECFTQEWTRKMPYRQAMIFEYSRASLLDNSNGLIQNGKLKIHFEMTNMIDSTEGDDSQTVKHSQMTYKSESKIDINQKSVHYVEYEWKIDKFSALCLNTSNNRYIDSQIFNPKTDNRYKFLLRLWPNGNGEINQRNVSIKLVNLSRGISDKATAQFRLSSLVANGDKRTRWGDQNSIAQYSTFIATDNGFIEQSILQNPSLLSQYIPNDNLTIICEIWVMQDKKIYKPQPTNTQSIVNNPSTSSAVVNMSNANLQGAIINVQSVSTVGDFNVKATSNVD